MPEIPSVERFKKYVQAHGLHKEIEKLDVLDDYMLQDITKLSLQKQLKGEEFKEVKRYGKFLLITLGKSEIVYFHFGMTGRFKYYEDEETPKYTRFLFNFKGGDHLAFVCPRKLGEVGMAESEEEFLKLKQLGPDALDKKFGEKEFKEIFGKGRGKIKSALMDQKKIAGIGNIWSDEILFQSYIHPNSSCNALDDEELKAMYKNMQKILKKIIAVKNKNYPVDYLISHRKEDAICPICSGRILKTKVSGRTAYFCNKHQIEIN